MNKGNEDLLFAPIAAKWLASGSEDDDEIIFMIMVLKAHFKIMAF